MSENVLANVLTWNVSNYDRRKHARSLDFVSGSGRNLTEPPNASRGPCLPPIEGGLGALQKILDFLHGSAMHSAVFSYTVWNKAEAYMYNCNPRFVQRCNIEGAEKIFHS